MVVGSIGSQPIASCHEVASRFYIAEFIRAFLTEIVEATSGTLPLRIVSEVIFMDFRAVVQAYILQEILQSGNPWVLTAGSSSPSVGDGS